MVIKFFDMLFFKDLTHFPVQDGLIAAGLKSLSCKSIRVKSKEGAVACINCIYVINSVSDLFSATIICPF